METVWKESSWRGAFRFAFGLIFLGLAGVSYTNIPAMIVCIGIGGWTIPSTLVGLHIVTLKGILSRMQKISKATTFVFLFFLLFFQPSTHESALFASALTFLILWAWNI